MNANRSDPVLLVLAAGMGSRYGGLKQLDPMGPRGETLLDFSLRDAHAAGFRRVVFVIREHLRDAFEQRLGSRLRGAWTVDYVYQEQNMLPEGHTLPAGRKKPWGTGHAVWVARTAVNTPLGVINADDYYGPEAYSELYRHLRTPPPPGLPCYAMVGYRLRDTLSEHGTVSRGVCRVDADGMLREIEEMTSIARAGDVIRHTYSGGRALALGGDEIVSMNIWGFTPAVFGHLERTFIEFLERHGRDPGAEFYIPAAVNRAVAAGWARVRVLPGGVAWFGVTYREDRDAVRQRLAGLASARAPEGRKP